MTDEAWRRRTSVRVGIAFVLAGLAGAGWLILAGSKTPTTERGAPATDAAPHDDHPSRAARPALAPAIERSAAPRAPIAPPGATQAASHTVPALGSGDRPAGGAPAFSSTVSRMAGDRQPGAPGEDDEEPLFSLDQDGLREGMGYKRPELQECYDAWRAAHPSLAGDVRVSFAVELDPRGTGRPTQIQLLESTVGHTFFEGCVVSVLESMLFNGKPGDTLEVTYPLKFRSDP